jgi:hypothetical protein
MFGNPFRPGTLGPACRTADVASLAPAVYEERVLPSGELDPARLAVLAGALEESGARGDLLTHLRGPGPHVRGCWAVDAVLIYVKNGKRPHLLEHLSEVFPQPAQIPYGRYRREERFEAARRSRARASS